MVVKELKAWPGIENCFVCAHDLGFSVYESEIDTKI